MGEISHFHRRTGAFTGRRGAAVTVGLGDWKAIKAARRAQSFDTNQHPGTVLTISPPSTIVRAMHGWTTICGICREIIR